MRIFLVQRTAGGPLLPFGVARRRRRCSDGL